MSRPGVPAALPGLSEAVGRSEPFLAFQERLSRAAGVDRPVLVIGERGTGKELAAARLHYLSRRWEGPFVSVNCATLTADLLNSELFGHEAGAFTGAARRRSGRFELAHEGTFFLDEIGSLGPDAQERILRVVEYGVFERVGGENQVSVDVRVIGAANLDLPALAEEGKFKHDLLDRLSFEVLTVPPLRDRHGDIPLLTAHFTSRMAVELGLDEQPEFSAQAMAALESHSWPGNVRELKNVVERAVFRSGGGRVEIVDFDPFASLYRPGPRPSAKPGPDSARTPAPTPAQAPQSPPWEFDPGLSLTEAVARLETAYLRHALDAAQHNQTKAAQRLGLTYHQFRGLYRKRAHRLAPRPGESE